MNAITAHIPSALCQEFIDIYANAKGRSRDEIEVALFKLWLEIIGTPPPTA